MKKKLLSILFSLVFAASAYAAVTTNPIITGMGGVNSSSCSGAGACSAVPDGYLGGDVLRYYSDDTKAQPYRYSGGLNRFITVATNRNMIPNTTSVSSTIVRQSRIRFTVAKNASYSNIRLTYTGWGENSASEFPSEANFNIKASIEYNGTNYPCPFEGGQPSVGVPKNATITSDACTGLTMAAGSTGYVITRQIGQPGSLARIINQGTVAAFGEGAAGGSDTTLDYTAGVYGKGATISSFVKNGAGAITSVTVGSGGTNYSTVPVLYIYEAQADGTVAAQTLASFCNRSGTVITSCSVTNGTPPTGATWTTPTFVFGNEMSNTTQTYGAAAITGLPSVPANSLTLVGDSIAIGFTSADGTGTAERNFGIYERAINNEIGVMNISSSGATLASHTGHASMYPLTYNFIKGLTTHQLIALGTNDIQSGVTKATIESNLNSLGNYFRSVGGRVSYATILPRGKSLTITGATKAANAVITVANTNVAGDTVNFSGIGGMSQLNGTTATVVSATSSAVTISTDSTGFGTYTSGGTMRTLAPATSQVPDTGFTLGGVADLVNADIGTATILVDWNKIDASSIFRDATTTQAWITSPANITTDMIHPGTVGLGYATVNTTLKSQFNTLH